jgi:hypothetical protein
MSYSLATEIINDKSRGSVAEGAVEGTDSNTSPCF